MDAKAVQNALITFGNIDEVSETANDGIGLGLSLAKAIVEAHAGELAIESTPGEGTKVTVTLPTVSQSGSLAKTGSG